jgi:hypothetical protein
MEDSDELPDPLSLSTPFKFAALAILLSKNPRIWQNSSPMKDVTRCAVNRLREDMMKPDFNHGFTLVINFLLECPSVMGANETLQEVLSTAHIWASSFVPQDPTSKQQPFKAPADAKTRLPTIHEADEREPRDTEWGESVEDDQSSLEGQLHESGLRNFCIPLTKEGMLRTSELRGLSQVEVRELGARIGMGRFHLDRFSRLAAKEATASCDVGVGDALRSCVDCSESFILTPAGRSRFLELGLVIPKRCVACRQLNRAAHRGANDESAMIRRVECKRNKGPAEGGSSDTVDVDPRNDLASAARTPGSPHPALTDMVALVKRLRRSIHAAKHHPARSLRLRERPPCSSFSRT